MDQVLYRNCYTNLVATIFAGHEVTMVAGERSAAAGIVKQAKIDLLTHYMPPVAVKPEIDIQAKVMKGVNSPFADFRLVVHIGCRS